MSELDMWNILAGFMSGNAVWFLAYVVATWLGFRMTSNIYMNGGAPIILQLKKFGMPGTAPAGFAAAPDDATKMKGVLAIIVFSIDLILRTGSCEVRE